VLAGGCLLLAGCPGPGGAKSAAKKPPPVNMTVEVGQANAARKLARTPIKVTLGQNERPISGTLELDDFRGNRTELAVELPRQANKVYTLYAPLSQPDDRNSPESAELVVREGGKVLAREKVQPDYTEARILVSATDDGSGLQFLHDQNRTRVAHLQPRDLPRHWAGYDPAGVVALNGRAWAAMDPDQRRALRMWVENGGRAVLCGEATTEWRDPEGRALAGVEPTRLATATSLQCLDAWGDVPFRAGEGSLLTVSGTMAPGGRTLFREAGRPLVVERQAGAGTVLWLGFDAFRQTVREWEGSRRFWNRTLEALQRGPDEQAVRAPDQVDELRAAAGALPRLPVPPMWGIVVFGVFYAVVFGPLNIWILRRLRRTVRAWLFVPALALGMTVVVLFAGQVWGNTRTVLNNVSVLQATSGGRTAQERSLVGLFSPTNRDFDLSVEEAAPLLEDRGSTDPQAADPLVLKWPRSQTDGVSRWDDVPLVLFSTRLLALERPRDLSGSLDANLDWTHRFTPGGSLTNGTNLGLKGAYLVSRGRYHWIGDLPAGGKATVGTEGWAPRLQGELSEASAAGQFLENQRFRQSVAEAWRRAGEVLLNAPQARSAVWLVGECEGFKGGLGVAQVPYSNQAGLLLVRIAPPERGSR
jgi:hypothetical protein